jgi:hypothetical protein
VYAVIDSRRRDGWEFRKTALLSLWTERAHRSWNAVRELMEKNPA